MDRNNTCNICKIRAYIQCDLCDKPLFFCSRGHLHTHKMKYHTKMTRSNSNSGFSTIKTNNEVSFSSRVALKEPQVDLRKLFEHIQTAKTEIEIKIKNQNYIEAILHITKCLPVAKKFYQDDPCKIEVLYHNEHR